MPKKKKNLGGAPEGNNNAELFKTPEERLDVFEEAVEHLSQGYSKQSFIPCDWQTLESMLVKYKVEFDAEKIERALREGFKTWEQMGILGVNGKIKGFSAATWIFNMKNRMGWKDSVELTGDNIKFIFGGDLKESQFTSGDAKTKYDKRQQAKNKKAK